MNFNKFINSDYLKENPLCGIDTYKDELNLATGVCMRKIRKLVFDGTENWRESSDINIYIALSPNQGVAWTHVLSTHFTPSQIQTNGGLLWFVNANVDFDTVEECKSYLAQQYVNGTPVTVWYVLATPITETITVPSGLSGTVEGYLNQSGTPTPTNPIYPTANTVEEWFDINHYIMGTSTDTITTLPAVIFPNAATATVGLQGNMSQSGTPTPNTPIMPQGCGERTANLLVFDTDAYIGGVNFNVTPVKGTAQFIINKVQTGSAQNCTIPLSIPLKQGTYTLSVNGIINRDGSYDRIYIRDEGGVIANYVQEGTSKTFTLANDTTITALSIPCGATSTYDNITVKVMLNTGSTALPYEPYGYKIPISSANTTTPVYLGEVQTTRKVKRYEFTGQETCNKADSTTETGTAVFSIRYDAIGMEDIIDYDQPMPDITYPVFISSHFKMKTNTSFGTLYTDIKNGEIGANSVGTNLTYNRYVIFASNQYTTVTNFKAYLAQQYAAGTPVTVWYVLATPETAVVNEPLRKIGEYADEVSNISIPVIAGGDTISVDTTVQPSEVTVNYKGWHPAIVHERTNGAWT